MECYCIFQQISPGMVSTEFRKRMLGLTEEETKNFYGQKPVNMH